MIPNKDELLKQTLLQYFDIKKLSTVYDIIYNKNPISIRKLEWFISVYCKDNDVKYKVTKGKKTKIFNVYNSYKNEQLKSYSKQYFDFFRRKKTFYIKIDESRKIETTVAQLNFFRWLIENKIIEYIVTNFKNIDNEMKNYKNKKILIKDISVTKNKIIISFE